MEVKIVCKATLLLVIRAGKERNSRSIRTDPTFIVQSIPIVLSMTDGNIQTK